MRPDPLFNYKDWGEQNRCSFLKSLTMKSESEWHILLEKDNEEYTLIFHNNQNNSPYVSSLYKNE